MIKKLFLIYLLSTYLFATKVTIYSECDYPPYSSCEDNQTVKGISVDIFKSIFTKIPDYTLEVKGIDWVESMEIMKKGINSKIRIIGTTAYKPKERSFIVNYSKPFIYSITTVFCKKEFPNREWPKDFYNLKIAFMKGFGKDKELTKAISNNLIELKYGNSRENILALFNDEVDCYINDEVAIRGEIIKIKKEYQDKNLSTIEFDKIKKIITIKKEAYHIGFSDAIFPEKKDLIKKINLAIKVMHNSKEIKDIINKNLKEYLNPYKIKTIDITLFNWGEFVSKDIEGNGALAAIISSAFKDRNIVVKYQFHSPIYSYLLTKWGKTCASLPWFKTEDREQYLYYSNPIKPSSTSILYLKDRFNNKLKYTRLDDLKKYKVGGLAGYSYEDIFYKKKFDYRSYREIPDAIRALILGEIDILVHNKYIIMNIVNKIFPNSKDRFEAHSKNFSEKNNYVIFSKRCKNSQEMLKEFNIGFENIKKDGTLKKILEKYDISEDIFYDYLFKIK